MTIKAEKYIRKPLYVDAVQVTEENFYEVAMWCNGEVDKSLNDQKYIQVRVHSPQSERQKQAFVGDWVLYANKGYKIYTDRAFRNSFDLEPTDKMKLAWEKFKSSYEDEGDEKSSRLATNRKHFRSGIVDPSGNK